MGKRKCVRCEKWKEAKKSNFRISRNGGFRNYCRACGAKLEATERKLRMFEALGFECACCGERQPDLLTLDHVKNNGNEHRKILQCHQIYWLARRQGWPKDEWQVLCMSCNWGRRFLGQCPHQSGKTPEAVLGEMRQILSWKGKRFRNYQEKVKEPEFLEKRPYKSQEMRGNKYAAELNEEKVREIKRLRSSGKLQRHVAKEFGVSRQLVGLIWLGKRWPEIE